MFISPPFLSLIKTPVFEFRTVLNPQVSYYNTLKELAGKSPSQMGSHSEILKIRRFCFVFGDTLCSTVVFKSTWWNFISCGAQSSMVWRSNFLIFILPSLGCPCALFWHLQFSLVLCRKRNRIQFIISIRIMSICTTVMAFCCCCSRALECRQLLPRCSIAQN